MTVLNRIYRPPKRPDLGFPYRLASVELQQTLSGETASVGGLQFMVHSET